MFEKMRLNILLWLSKFLPVVPFTRLNREGTDPKEFSVPRWVLHRNFPADWARPVEVSSTLIVIGAEGNHENGWHGFVTLPYWVEVGSGDDNLASILGQAVETETKELNPISG